MDPRSYGPQNRKANHSPLMAAKLAAEKTGDKANFCPFGCTIMELDNNGYCCHLVGFLPKLKAKKYEPFVLDRGRWVIHGSEKKPLPKDAKLVQITCSYRVYSEEHALENWLPPDVQDLIDDSADDDDEEDDEETSPAAARAKRKKAKEPV